MLPSKLQVVSAPLRSPDHREMVSRPIPSAFQRRFQHEQVRRGLNLRNPDELLLLANYLYFPEVILVSPDPCFRCTASATTSDPGAH